jgi:hypothetical protein
MTSTSLPQRTFHLPDRVNPKKTAPTLERWTDFMSPIFTPLRVFNYGAENHVGLDGKGILRRDRVKAVMKQKQSNTT